MKNIQRLKVAFVAALAVLGLGSCANMTPQEQNRATGQVVGGVTAPHLVRLWAVAPDATVAIASGAVIGTVVGGQVGSQQK